MNSNKMNTDISVLKNIISKGMHIESAYEKLKYKADNQYVFFLIEKKQELVTDFIMTVLNLIEDIYSVRGMFNNEKLCNDLDFNTVDMLDNDFLIEKASAKIDESFHSLLNNAINNNVPKLKTKPLFWKHYRRFQNILEYKSNEPQLVG